MTQENSKQLLLRDLCARLPYGVVVQIISKHPIILGDGNESYEFDEPYNVLLTIGDHDGLVDFFDGDWVTDIKPYLRSMSSMTKEELREYNHLYAERENNNEFDDIKQYSDLINWLLKNHFDYYGLIPIGLALEAPDGTYKEQTMIIERLSREMEG